MKQYIIKKIIKASSIKDALSKEREAEVDSIYELNPQNEAQIIGYEL
jgi:hypothetical protein